MYSLLVNSLLKRSDKPNELKHSHNSPLNALSSTDSRATLTFAPEDHPRMDHECTDTPPSIRVRVPVRVFADGHHKNANPILFGFVANIIAISDG